MADKYHIPDLRKVAANKFVDYCESGPELSLELYLQVVRFVYTCLPETDRSLRKPLTKALAFFFYQSPKSTIKNHEEYRHVCSEYPLFGLDMQMEFLLTAHVGEPGWGSDDE